MAAVLALPAGLASAGDEAVVLRYQRFGEDRHPSTSVSLDQFDAHLEYLLSHGYTVVPLGDVVASIKGRVELPDRAVAITVDDACRSVYESAWPRLRRYGFPFTVFVATDLIDAHRPDYMTWEQMREMEAKGVSFASLGASHRSFVRRRGVASEVDRLQRVRADVEQAARRLDVELSPLEAVIAYPYGEYDTSVAALVEELGYVAFGQHSGALGPTSDPRALPRFPMAEAWAALEDFAVKVATRPLPVVAVDPWDPVTVSRRPRLEVTLAEDTEARLEQLACYVGGQGEVPVEWLEAGRRFAVTPRDELDYGRGRVNCTAPSIESGRFHWFCHPWIVRSRESP